MGTDFSRVRLNPLLDFAGVELKQGGLLLDADTNELVEIIDRRLRALASDVLGRATVSATTVDAFKIAVAGSTLTAGKGRLYVDGLLAENHGAQSTLAGDQMFDDLLAERQFVNPISYDAQPYFPNPPALPEAGRHLVYLDVWDREVTFVEAPDLVESAVGVDTSSRIQTVWQLRVLGDDAGQGTTCATPDGDVPGWDAVIAPSTGVLTTGTFEVAPVDDPCELPPTGGYRGLENQLYRVEIQDPGQTGTATFKWSRENASIASRVASIISASELELVSLGRDDLLAFKTGDWVEVLDDEREFSQGSGEMRKITVDAATRRITFAPALPAATLPGAFPDSVFADQRNLRVRKWEQSGRIFRTDVSGTPVQVQDLDAVGSTGVITVLASGVTLLLENGVTVSFDVTGPEGFHAGDHWVFAARTADASVEGLNRAPPRGIHHHYARLAIWDVGAGTVTDCRQPWPPVSGGQECCCTACVTAESHASGAFTLQDAVNKVAQTGGTVCIGPGQFALRTPVLITGTKALRIHGQGAATLIACAGSAFVIRNALAIGVDSLAILSLARQPAISVQSAIGLTLRDLLIAVLQNSDFGASAIALQGFVASAVIERNVVFGTQGILANDAAAPVEEGSPAAFLMAAALNIRDNILWCAQSGIVLDGQVLHLLDTSVTGNDIVMCNGVAISALGVGLAGSSFAIRENTVDVRGSGIRCGVKGIWVCDNKVGNTFPGNSGTGIALAAGTDKSGIDQGHVLANQITGFGEAGIVVSAPVTDLIVKLNIITRCGNGILLTDSASGGALSIENNHLRDIDAQTAGIALPPVIGIGVIRAQTANIIGNTLQRIGLSSPQTTLRAGILTMAVARVRISGNEVTDLAPPGDFGGSAAGIMVLAPLVDAEVAQNRVERDSLFTTLPSNGTWQALVMRAGQGQPQFSKAGPFATVQLDTARTLVLGAGRAFVQTSVFGAAANSPAGPGGSVLGNVLNGRGNAPVAEIALAQCLFNDNRVDARQNGKVAVTIAAPVVIMNANRITGEEESVVITEATAKSAVVLGNITTRGIALSGAGLAAPWDVLNLRF